MDFMKQYDARGAAEIARKVPILDKDTGEHITNGGKGCYMLIKGSSSRSVQAQMRAEAMEDRRAKAEREKAAGKSAKGKAEPEDDDATVQRLHEQLVKAAVRLCDGFENVQTLDENGKVRGLTKSDAPAFFDLNFISMTHLMKKEDTEGWTKPSFAQQAVDAAQEDADFLKASEGKPASTQRS